MARKTAAEKIKRTGLDFMQKSRVIRARLKRWGTDNLDNVREAMRRDTQRFARRQRTWFRAIESAIWCHPADDVGILKRVEDFLEPR